MNAQPYSLAIHIMRRAPTDADPPGPWDPAGTAFRAVPAAGSPMTFLCQHAAIWHRAIWLHATFWEETAQRPTGRLENPPAAPGQAWVDIRLSRNGRPPISQVSGLTGLPLPNPFQNIQIPEKLSFPIADGHLNLAPFHIRLPPGLIFRLGFAADQTFSLDLTHPLLGVFFSAHIHRSSHETAKEPIPC